MPTLGSTSRPPHLADSTSVASISALGSTSHVHAARQCPALGSPLADPHRVDAHVGLDVPHAHAARRRHARLAASTRVAPISAPDSLMSRARLAWPDSPTPTHRVDTRAGLDVPLARAALQLPVLVLRFTRPPHADSPTRRLDGGVCPDSPTRASTLASARWHDPPTRRPWATLGL
ncbi:hypothetical protein B0H14DRAFT_2995623, partial [Mycena olivaceomarginata]